MPNHKKLVIIIIAITIFATGGILWWANEDNNYNPTPQQTTINSAPKDTTPPIDLNAPEPDIEWQTYTNTKLGFSVEVPRGFSAREYSSQLEVQETNSVSMSGYYTENQFADKQESFEFGVQYWPSINEYLANENSYSRFNDISTYLKSDDAQYSVIGETKINNENAIVALSFGHNAMLSVFVEHGAVYKLYYPNLDNPDNLGVVDKHILRSFKFISQD